MANTKKKPKKQITTRKPIGPDGIYAPDVRLDPIEREGAQKLRLDLPEKLPVKKPKKRYSLPYEKPIKVEQPLPRMPRKPVVPPGRKIIPRTTERKPREYFDRYGTFHPEGGQTGQITGEYRPEEKAKYEEFKKREGLQKQPIQPSPDKTQPSQVNYYKDIFGQPSSTNPISEQTFIAKYGENEGKKRWGEYTNELNIGRSRTFQKQQQPTPEQTALGSTPTPARYGEEAERFYEDVITPEKTPEEIREAERERVEEQVDIIEEGMAEQMRRTEEAGVEAVGRERALASRAGLLTSPRGIGQIEKVKGKVREEVRGVEREKEAMVMDVLDKAENRAKEEIRYQEDRTTQGTLQYLDYLKEGQGEARENVKFLAQSNVPLQNLKQDEAYASLVRQTGYPEPIFDMLYEAGRPEAEAPKIIFKEKTADGKLAVMFQDPTGQVRTEKYDWDLPDPELIDGVPYLTERDEQGNPTGYKPIPGVAGDIMTIKDVGVISMQPDGTYDVIIPRTEEFEFTRIPGQGLYRVSETGEASLIIPEPKEPAKAFYSASDLINIAKTLPQDQTRTITDPNTDEEYTLQGLKEVEVPKPFFKGADIMGLMKTLEIGQMQTITDPSTGYTFEVRGIKPVPEAKPFYSGSDILGVMKTLEVGQSQTIVDPNTGSSFEITGLRPKEEVKPFYSGSDILGFAKALSIGETKTITDPNTDDTFEITGVKSVPEAKPFYSGSDIVSLAKSLKKGETRTITDPETDDTYTIKGLKEEPEKPFYSGSDIVNLTKALKEGETKEITDPNTGDKFTIKGLKEREEPKPFYKASDLVNIAKELKEGEEKIVRDPTTLQYYVITGTKEEKPFYTGSNIVSIARELAVGESQTITDPNTGDKITIKGLKKPDEVKPFWTSSSLVSLAKALKEGETKEIIDPNTKTKYTVRGLKEDEPKVKSIQSTDEEGNVTITSYTVDNLGRLKITGQANAGRIGKGKAETAEQRDLQEILRVQNELTDYGKRNDVSKGYYQKVRTESTLSPSEFDKRFSHLLTEAERKEMGLKTEKLSISQATLNKLAITGIKNDLALDIQDALNLGVSPEKIKQGMKNAGLDPSLYDKFVAEMEKAGQMILVPE